MRILVCDDDIALVSMVKFKLTREQLGIIDIASDGREALDMLKSNTYDIVVTDIHMPYHSGLELISFIREKKQSSIPIIVLSAEGLENTVLQAFELGASDFITKPFSPSELVVRIKRLAKP